jgi:hypothetical protein
LNPHDNGNFTYNAFITYPPEHPNGVLAGYLLKKLQNYRPPRDLAEQVRPILQKSYYLDTETSCAVNDLTAETVENLRQSRFLIVICSPGARQSERIIQEIEFFRGLGRERNILVVLAKGQPEESIPETLYQSVQNRKVANQPETREMLPKEPFFADIGARGLYRSLWRLRDKKLQLIAPILGCRYDDLIQRHHRRKVWRLRVFIISANLVLLIAGIYTFWQLRYTETQIRRLKTTRDQALQNVSLAEVQTPVVFDAVYQMYIETPHRFANIPGAALRIKQLLTENYDYLTYTYREYYIETYHDNMFYESNRMERIRDYPVRYFRDKAFQIRTEGRLDDSITAFSLIKLFEPSEAEYVILAMEVTAQWKTLNIHSQNGFYITDARENIDANVGPIQGDILLEINRRSFRSEEELEKYVSGLVDHPKVRVTFLRKVNPGQFILHSFILPGFFYWQDGKRLCIFDFKII